MTSRPNYPETYSKKCIVRNMPKPSQLAELDFIPELLYKKFLIGLVLDVHNGPQCVYQVDI